MIYCLENENVIAKIKAHGCELIYLFDKSSRRNYLYEGKSEAWNRQSPILFPIIGKVRNGSIVVDGHSYYMPVHGFAKDSYFECISKSNSELKMLLRHSEKTLEMYPFKFDLIITHTIKDATLSISFEIINTDSKPIYASIGGHPGFKLERNTSIEAYTLVFDKRIDIATRRRYNDLLSITKETIVDNAKSYNIKKNDFRSGPMIIEDWVNRVTLINESIGYSVKVDMDDFDVLGLWTRESMIENAEFICIEPWCGIDDLEGTLSCEFKEKARVKEIEVGKCRSLSYSITLG